MLQFIFVLPKSWRHDGKRKRNLATLNMSRHLQAHLQKSHSQTMDSENKVEPIETLYI